MALRLTKPRAVEKASYYVWFLGALESRGLRGRRYVEPVVRELTRKEQHVDPTKVTLQVSDKGLKIVQHVPKKGGKGRTEPVKHFIPDHAITCAVQEPAPDQDIVSCILLIFNPVTKCPVHVHTYRCDAPETAAMLATQLQALASRPDNRAHIEQIEQRLLERGLLEPPTPPAQEPPADPAPHDGPGSGSGSGSVPVATLYDSLAAELRTRIHSRDCAPLLLPPPDYNQEATTTANGKSSVQEDSSGIGSDDAPSPDHRERERTSSDEEWEAAGQSTEDLLFDSSSPWRQGRPWRRERSAGGQSPDTDELLTPARPSPARPSPAHPSPAHPSPAHLSPAHLSPRKPASQRQRSPSSSPQDRFNNARLKFVQMEQDKQASPPPAVSPKRLNTNDLSGTRAADGERSRDWRSPSSDRNIDVSPDREASPDKGWCLPPPAKELPSRRGSPRDDMEASKGWRQSREPSREPDPSQDRPRDPEPTRQRATGGSSAEAELRRDARGRPHVADIFRQAASEAVMKPANERRDAHRDGQREDRRESKRDDQRDTRRDNQRDSQRDDLRDELPTPSDARPRRSGVRTGRQEPSGPFQPEADPPPEQVHARVDRWVRSSAAATPFTRALSYDESTPVAPSRPATAAAEPEQRTGRHASDSGVDASPAQLAKWHSSDAFADPPTPAVAESEWRRSSAQVTAELAQQQRARRVAEPRSPVTRHRSGASLQSDGVTSERRGRYQELKGSSRLPGLDRATATRDPLLPPAQWPRQAPAQNEPPRADVRPRGNQAGPDRRPPGREQRRGDERRQEEARTRHPDEGRARYPDEGRARYPDEGRARQPDGGRARQPDEGRARHPDEGRARYPDEGLARQPDEGRARYPEEIRPRYLDDHRPRNRHQEAYRHRADAIPPVNQAYSDQKKAYPGYDPRGRSRHSLADPVAMTQYDYRARVAAYPH